MENILSLINMEEISSFINSKLIILVAVVLIGVVILALVAAWKLKKIYDKGARLLKGGVKKSVIKQLMPLYHKAAEYGSRCSSCGRIQKQDAEYCHNCGHNLFIMCSECGMKIKADDKFCHKCGNRQSHVIEEYQNN